MSSSHEMTDFGISLDANSPAVSDYKCDETSLLPKDLSDWLDQSLSQPNDPLSLLMRDLDFDAFQSGLTNHGLPRCETNIEFDNKLMFNDGSSSSDSPLSPDSGNHSPKSLSSSEAVCDMWQVNPLNKITDDHLPSEYATISSHKLNAKGDESVVPNYESMDVTESYDITSTNAKQMNFANEVDETLTMLDSAPNQTNSVRKLAPARLRPPARLVPVQLPIQQMVACSSQASSSTNQPVIYILPSSSNSVPTEQQTQSPNVYTQNIVNNVQFLSSNNIDHSNNDNGYITNKRPFPTTANRSQPYPSIRPKLITPKREISSPPPAVPIIANPIQIQTVNMPAITNAVITPITTITGGLQLIGCRTASTTPATTVTRNMSADSDFDEFSRKKEDRKIRNRASAQLSRIRKRNEIDAMKQTIVEKDALIAKLKEENKELKETISLLRTEGEIVKHKKVNERARVAAGTVCVAVVIMMVTFSHPSLLRYNPVSVSVTEKFPLNTFEKGIKNSIEQHGRTLLSIDYDSERSGNSNEEERPLHSKEDVGGIVDMGIGTLNISNLSDCNETSRIYWNQTEAIRLNNDLSNWVDRHERVQFIQTRRIFRPPSREHSPKSVSVSTNSTVNHRSKQNARITPQMRRSTNDKKEEARLKAVRERAWRHIDMISTGAAADSESSQQKLRDRHIKSALFTESYTNVPRRNSKRLRDKPTLDSLTASSVQLKYMDLTRTLKQRDDTLYVIAMKDYYLLPATDRNITMHPKVALILPALSYNGTFDNQVPMMRIECEITGTGLFHIADSLVSLFNTQSV